MSEFALEARGLGKRYGKKWALRDCTLEIPTGCVAALVGPNGAGKTTLLHLAVGLTDATAGSVRVLGRSAWERPEVVLPRLGFVPDVPSIVRINKLIARIIIARRIDVLANGEACAGG